jgi:hypothetical protein
MPHGSQSSSRAFSEWQLLSANKNTVPHIIFGVVALFCFLLALPVLSASCFGVFGGGGGVVVAVDAKYLIIVPTKVAGTMLENLRNVLKNASSANNFEKNARS